MLYKYYDAPDAFDPDAEVVTLLTPEGEEAGFTPYAWLALNGVTYAILAPTPLPEDMSEDDALVFSLDTVKHGSVLRFTAVTSDRILDAVFAEYERLLAEEE